MKDVTDISDRIFDSAVHGNRAQLTDEETQLTGSLEDDLHDKAWVGQELHHMERFDTVTAYDKFRRSLKGEEQPSRATHYLLWAAAAVAVILLGFTWWRGSYSPVPPVIDSETAQAIRRVEQSGGQEATLTAEGKTTNVNRLQDIHSYHGQQQLRTSASKEFWVTLDDGTRVHLNNNSTLSYPSSFGSGERRVQLDGEAYFMVATDSRRKFIVETREGEIQDYGTQFNVNTTTVGSTQVALVEGSVGVTPVGGSQQMMRPDQLATIKHGKIEIKNADLAPYVAWNTGTFLFHNYQIDDLLKIISDWHNVTITCGSNEVRSIRLSGALDRYSSFDDLCTSLEAITGHHVVKSGPRKYVLK